MTILAETVHHTLEHDATRGLVRYTRTDVPFDVATLEAAFDTVRAALATLDRPGCALLVDMRRVPLHGNEALEKALREKVDRYLAGFPRRAILVRTAVGVLQVNRLTQQGPHATDGQAIFRDEGEALAWLLAR